VIKVVVNLKGEEVEIGDKVLCYDMHLDEMKEGIVVNIYKYVSCLYDYTGEYVSDIDFKHRDEISKGHFVSGLELIK